MRVKYKSILFAGIIFLVAIIAFVFINESLGTKENNSSQKEPTVNYKNITETNTQNKPKGLIFEAVITNIRQNEIEISVTGSGDSGFYIGETLILITESLDESLYSSLELNDNISVEFDGIVMNSYPGKIGSIYNIIVIDNL